MYNMINTIDTAVCYIWKLLNRVNPKSSHHKEKTLFFYFFNFVSIWDDGCSLNLLWSSFRDISHIIMLYTLNSYSAVYLLYLSKTGRKNKM